MAKKTTANEPAAAVDPGGTKPSKAKAKPSAGSKQKVQSGDRNTMPNKKAKS